jgi:hypothetical protein
MPSIAVVTMAYNEHENLPLWVAHYRQGVPNGALFVIDHGSDDGSVLAQPGVSRVPVPRRFMDEGPRTRFVYLFQGSLLQYYDIVIYTDCDEFIVVEPSLCVTLEQYLAQWAHEYAAPVGLNVQHIPDIEPPLQGGLTLLSQRGYCYFRSDMCKTLISRVRLKWEPGFHRCDRPLRIDPHLYLFHIKSIDRDRALRRQAILQAVRWTRRAREAAHGVHHRFDDALFLRQFFLDPANRFKRDGVGAFGFDDELGRMHYQPETGAAVAPELPFDGPLVRIPIRFNSAF